MNKEINDDRYVIFLFCLTNIIERDSKCIISGSKKDDTIRNAYGIELENDVMFLKGKVSRKKYIQSSLNKALENL